MLEQPIFLVGSERSGTTLLRLMLDSHPEVAFIEEFEYAFSQIKDGKIPDPNDYYKHLETDRVFQNSGFELDNKLTYKQQIDSFLLKRQTNKKAELVGATVHYGFTNIPALYPNAKYVHIVRDPRDVAASIVKMGWAANHWCGLDKWIEAEQEWQTLLTLTKENQRYEIRFEKLIDSTEEQLNNLTKFLNIKFSSEMFSYSKDTDYKIPSTKESKNWRQSLSDRQVQIIESRISKMMSQLGYKPELEPIKLSNLQIIKLKILNKIGVHRNNLSKYGINLYIKDQISRRTPILNYKKVKEQMFRIDNKQLKKSWRNNKTDHASAK